MFTFVNSIAGLSSASCSRIGVTARQGPHQGAQKSTTTGPSARRTSASKLSSVTSFTARWYRGSEPVEQGSEPEQQHAPDRLEHDRAAHLRVPDLAVDEDDRHLDDAE